MTLLHVAGILVTSVASAAAADAYEPVSGGTPALDELPSFGWMFVQMLLVLAALLLGLWLALKWLTSRRTPGVWAGRGKLIEMIDVYRIEPRKTLYLVRVAGQFMLLGASEGELRTLAGGQLDEVRLNEALGALATEAGKGRIGRPSAARSFREWLKRPQSEGPS